MQCLVQLRGQVEDILLLALWPVLSLEFLNFVPNFRLILYILNSRFSNLVVLPFLKIQIVKSKSNHAP